VSVAISRRLLSMANTPTVLTACGESVSMKTTPLLCSSQNSTSSWIKNANMTLLRFMMEITHRLTLFVIGNYCVSAVTALHLTPIHVQGTLLIRPVIP
jgi:hypothetical protein